MKHWIIAFWLRRNYISKIIPNTRFNLILKLEEEPHTKTDVDNRVVNWEEEQIFINCAKKQTNEIIIFILWLGETICKTFPFFFSKTFDCVFSSLLSKTDHVLQSEDTEHKEYVLFLLFLLLKSKVAQVYRCLHLTISLPKNVCWWCSQFLHNTLSDGTM